MEVLKDLDGFDTLSLKKNADVLKQLKTDEWIYFSNKVTKYNRFEWSQERVFMITNIAIYNLKKHKIQRWIPLKNISGMTKSTDK